MRIVVTDQSNGTNHIFDIDPTDTINQLKAKLSSKTGYLINSFKIHFKGVALDDFSNFRQNQINENDTVTCVGGTKKPQPNQQQPAYGQPAHANPFGSFPPNQNQQRAAQMGKYQQEAVELRKYYETRSSDLNMLLERDPELAQAILSDDIQDTVDMIAHRHQQQYQAKLKKIQEDQRLDSDPFNPEYQKQIEERIRKERLDKHL